MKNLFTSFFLYLILVGFVRTAYAQEKPKLYSPEADAKAQVKEAVAKAKAEGKQVFLQIGGNWCGWCLKFNKLSTTDAQIDSSFKANYVVAHINYSKENMNLALLEQLHYPQRFGFPVFVILNDKGERIHTQNSAYLEKGDGYDKTRILEFLKNWSTSALNPKHYQK